MTEKHEEHTKTHTHKQETEEHQAHKHRLEEYPSNKKGIKKSDIWKTAAIIASILLLISLWFNLSDNGTATTGEKLSSEEASEKAIVYINQNLLSGTSKATVTNVTEEKGMYKLALDIGGRAYESYISYDGELLFPQAINLEEAVEQPKEDEQAQPQPEETPKTDKPVANAFVMSYCPYGLQFMKAYVPVIELLGNKADVQLNFVPYAMHGEKELTENSRMYCIQKEQRDKLTEYLRCFIESDDSEACQTEVGIDKAKLDSCMDATDKEFKITEMYNDQSTWSGGRYPQYPVNQGLATKYGVSGSPTFVVNGKKISVNRSPEAVKQAICEAFATPPAECEETLSSSAESPGIGPLGQASASGSTASCG